MRGVRKNKIQKKFFFFFFIKLFFYTNFELFFLFLRSSTIRFFYFSVLHFFFPKVQISFFSLSTEFINNYIKRNTIIQFFKNNVKNYVADDFDSFESIKQTSLKKKFIIKMLETQFMQQKHRVEHIIDTENLLSGSDSESLSDTEIVNFFVSPNINATSNTDKFLHSFAYSYLLADVKVLALPFYSFANSSLSNYFICAFSLKFLNNAFTFFFFKNSIIFNKIVPFNNLSIDFDFFFFEKSFLPIKIFNSSIILQKEETTFFSLREQQQFFLNKYFNIFSSSFFCDFINFGVKFSSKFTINQKLLSSLLFLPDAFLFLNYSGFFVQEGRYFEKCSNIVPIFNIKLNLRFRKKRSLPLKNVNIFLWYLLNFFETKLQKPVFLKLIYSRKAIFKKSIYSYCIRVFRKLKRYNFRFKRNFFLGELIRITIISLMSRDSTLFMNYIT